MDEGEVVTFASQSLLSRAMSFDEKPKAKFWLNIGLSQSLSSRAMSFDRTTSGRTTESNVSIPFDQGDVFRRSYSYYHQRTRYVSIPFDQGNVFRLLERIRKRRRIRVSIPFDQSDVFRPANGGTLPTDKSQSLSIRAMSFDL